MNTRLRWMLAALLALVVLLPACGEEAGDSPSEAASAGEEDMSSEGMSSEESAASVSTIKEGVLTVCTDAPYKPMEFEENGEFTGFDIELMRAIAGEMGLELEVFNSGFDPITSGTALESDQCDIAAASITITPEREKSISFTDPYFDADQSLLVKKDGDVDSLEALSGKTIGVQSGTTGKAYAEENAPDDAQIKAFENPGDIFVALEAGEIDGVVQDLVVNQGRAIDDDSVEVVETYPTDEQYGFALAKDNEELLTAANEALQTLRDNGTYDDLFEEWFGGA